MISQIITFLQSIGLQVEETPGVEGFLQGVAIAGGTLQVDISTASASDLLHEAGHLAIVPEQFRHLVTGDVEPAIMSMLETITDLNLPPDHPLERAVLQCSDCEATAWAYAAGVHLGLCAETVILDDQYQNTGREIRLMLQSNRYFGIHGLSSAGFCAVNEGISKYTKLPVYPVLAKWTQPLICPD